MIKKLAFTLAEILIALGIVGVISAITIPSMINNYQNNANAIQLRKVLNEISTAADLAITEEGKQNLEQIGLMSILEYIPKPGGTITTPFDNFIMNKFKVIKECEASKPTGCFNDKYRSIDGNKNSPLTCLYKSYVLANSAAICLAGPPIYILANGRSFPGLALYIDINGVEPPNIGGRDMFHVELGSDTNIYGYQLSDKCGLKPYGEGCLNKLLESNWKMNY